MKKIVSGLMTLPLVLGCVACAGVEDPSSEPTLKGKNFVFLGSSVTLGVNGYSMCEYLSEQYGCTIEKLAQSSTWLIDNDNTSYISRLKVAAPYISDCDHFVCQLSTNGSGIPLGEVSESYDPEDFDTSTIIGAVEYITATAKNAWNCPVSFYTSAYYESTKYASWVDALYLVQEKWGIGVLDLYNDAEFNNITDDQRAEYMRDSVHPTQNGYRLWWTPKFAEHLLKY